MPLDLCFVLVPGPNISKIYLCVTEPYWRLGNTKGSFDLSVHCSVCFLQERSDVRHSIIFPCSPHLVRRITQAFLHLARWKIKAFVFCPTSCGKAWNIPPRQAQESVVLEKTPTLSIPPSWNGPGCPSGMLFSHCDCHRCSLKY